MKIKPLGDVIQLKKHEFKAGVLDTSSRASATEYWEVVAVGDEVKVKVKKGDKLFVKAWAVDLVEYDGEKYAFVKPETGGILAIVS